MCLGIVHAFSSCMPSCTPQRYFWTNANHDFKRVNWLYLSQGLSLPHVNLFSSIGPSLSPRIISKLLTISSLYQRSAEFFVKKSPKYFYLKKLNKKEWSLRPGDNLIPQYNWKLIPPCDIGSVLWMIIGTYLELTIISLILFRGYYRSLKFLESVWNCQ